jgi:hypothetical protein
MPFLFPNKKIIGFDQICNPKHTRQYTFVSIIIIPLAKMKKKPGILTKYKWGFYIGYSGGLVALACFHGNKMNDAMDSDS